MFNRFASSSTQKLFQKFLGNCNYRHYQQRIKPGVVTAFTFAGSAVGAYVGHDEDSTFDTCSYAAEGALGGLLIGVSLEITIPIATVIGTGFFAAKCMRAVEKKLHENKHSSHIKK